MRVSKRIQYYTVVLYAGEYLLRLPDDGLVYEIDPSRLIPVRLGRKRTLPTVLDYGTCKSRFDVTKMLKENFGT